MSIWQATENTRRILEILEEKKGADQSPELTPEFLKTHPHRIALVFTKENYNYDDYQEIFRGVTDWSYVTQEELQALKWGVMMRHSQSDGTRMSIIEMPLDQKKLIYETVQEGLKVIKKRKAEEDARLLKSEEERLKAKEKRDRKKLEKDLKTLEDKKKLIETLQKEIDEEQKSKREKGS